MFKPKNNSTEFNFWPSIADTLLAIFMVFLMLWLTEKLIFLQQLGHVQAGNEALTEEFGKLNKECTKYKDDLYRAKTEGNIKENSLKNAMLGWQICKGTKETCKQEKLRCEQDQIQIAWDLKICEKGKGIIQEGLKKCKKVRFKCDKPPIIILSEGDTAKFSFPTGDAKLSPEFEETLSGKIDELVKIKKKYGVDVIEVIGHTDGELTNRKNSNLDIELENAVKNRDISNLRYGSNADLGLMRALAVAFFLQNQSQLNGVKFRVYSAAQLILPTGKLADTPARQQDKTRRRIELRFTHLGN